jgi:hypothetical protein
MTGISYQAMFMPVRLHVSFIPFLILALLSLDRSRSAIPPVSLDIARIGKPRRPACLKTCSAKLPRSKTIGSSSARCSLTKMPAAVPRSIAPRRPCIEKRAIAQIFAIMLDQVEEIEDRAAVGRRSAPLLNARQAFGPQNQLPAVTDAESAPRTHCPVIVARVREACLRSGC